MMMMMMMPDDKDGDDGYQEVNGWVGLEQETELLPIESTNLLSIYHPHQLLSNYPHHLLCNYPHNLKRSLQQTVTKTYHCHLRCNGKYIGVQYL